MADGQERLYYYASLPFISLILGYGRSFWQHINRIPRNRLPRIIKKKNYRPIGRITSADH